MDRSSSQGSFDFSFDVNAQLAGSRLAPLPEHSAVDDATGRSPRTTRETGLSLFFLQVWTLFIAKVYVYVRSPLRAVAPLVLIGLSLCVIRLMEDAGIAAAETARDTRYRSMWHAEPRTVAGIPDCEDMWQRDRRVRCYTIAYWPNDAEATRVIRAIQSSNEPPIPNTKVIGFAEEADIDTHLLRNPGTVLGAVYLYLKPFGCNVVPITLPLFNGTTPPRCTRADFVVQTNSTPNERRYVYDDATFEQLLPLQVATEREDIYMYIYLQVATERELSRLLLNHEITWNVRFVPFPHPVLAERNWAAAGEVLFLLFALFSSAMEWELTPYEQGLRHALFGVVPGTAVGCSCLIFGFFTACFDALLVSGLAMALDLPMFQQHEFAIVFTLNLGLSFALHALGAGLAPSIRTNRRAALTTASVFGVVVLTAVGMANREVQRRERRPMHFPSKFTEDEAVDFIAALLPWVVWQRAIMDLHSRATGMHGEPTVRWADVASCCSEWPLEQASRWLYGEWIMLMAVAMIVQHRAGAHKTVVHLPSSAVRPDVDEYSVMASAPPDVQEHARETFNNKEGWDKTAMRVTGVHRSQQLRETWFSVRRYEMLSIVGARKSGKSSLVRMMCAAELPFGGEVQVNVGSFATHPDASLSRARLDTHFYTTADRDDAAAIRRTVGIGWIVEWLMPDITVEEHMVIVAQSRGIPATAAKRFAESLLPRFGLLRHERAVDLGAVQQRLLCMALAFVGEPEIVLLDEPAAGMHAASKRVILRALQPFKGTRTIVLGLASLDDAEDVGADRCVVLAHGSVIAVAPPHEFRERAGSMFEVSIDIPRGLAEHERIERIEEIRRFLEDQVHVTVLQRRKTQLAFVTRDGSRGSMTAELRTVFQALRGGNLVVEHIAVDAVPVDTWLVHATIQAQVMAAGEHEYARLEHEGSWYRVPLRPKHTLQVSFDGCIERSEPLGDADLPPKIAQLPQKGGEKGAHDFVELSWGLDENTGRATVTRAATIDVDTKARFVEAKLVPLKYRRLFFGR